MTNMRSICTCAEKWRKVGRVSAQRIDLLVAQVRQQLAEPLPTDPTELVAGLARAAGVLSEALDEAMARAALDGASLRSIAGRAGVAPNSVPPRLARSQALAEYADAGKVSAEAVVVARADRARGMAPLAFVPRRGRRGADA